MHLLPTTLIEKARTLRDRTLPATTFSTWIVLLFFFLLINLIQAALLGSFFFRTTFAKPSADTLDVPTVQTIGRADLAEVVEAFEERVRGFEALKTSYAPMPDPSR